jgi:hypothetical protein
MCVCVCVVLCVGSGLAIGSFVLDVLYRHSFNCLYHVLIRNLKVKICYPFFNMGVKYGLWF